MTVNTQVVHTLLVSTLSLSGLNVHTMTNEDTYIAGDWDGIQEFLYQQITGHALEGIPLGNLSFEVM